MAVGASHYYDNDCDATVFQNADDNIDGHGSYTKTAIPSSAEHCKERDKIRKIILQKRSARRLASDLAARVKGRPGSLWNLVPSDAMNWRPEDNDRCHRQFRGPRRTILYHLAALFDVNECELEFLNCSQDEKMKYYESLYTGVSKEFVSLQAAGSFSFGNIEALFNIFHVQMRDHFRKHGRYPPYYDLSFWRDSNRKIGEMSPMPFNKVAKAFISSQASSASSERLLSDLGRLEGRQSQSMLSSTVEITELISVYVKMQLQANNTP